MGTIPKWCRARALLDTGSEVNIMSARCARFCKLQLHPPPGDIAGVGGSQVGRVLGTTQAILYQPKPHPHLRLDFYVLPKAANNLPSVQLENRNWAHLSHLARADESFHSPGPIDLILSATVFDELVKAPFLPSQNGSPNARNSTLGYLMSGPGTALNEHQTHKPSRTASPKRTELRVHFHPDVEDNAGCSKHYRLEHSLRRRASPRTKCTPPVEKISDPVNAIPPPKRQRTIPPRCGKVFQSTAIAPHANPNSTAINAALTTAITSKRSLRRLRNKWEALVSSGPHNALAITAATVSAATTAAENPPNYAELLQRMFALEGVPSVQPLTPDELLAEEQFVKTARVLPSGRYSVRLPLRGNATQLGSSRNTAVNRLCQLEHRHTRHPELREPYQNFMLDYIQAGHMEPAPPTKASDVCYYIPHHAVHRPGDPPEKIRVVFNASQKTSSGFSLNDILLPGPRLQADIWRVVTNFRLDKWVFTADIRQMFRQIQHPPQDRDLLRILWRFDMHDPIKEYRLTTVTYGTTSAPFLACRTLQAIAESAEHSRPLAAHILRNRTYVDDINGGGDSLQAAMQAREEITQLLHSHGIELRKWAANDPRVLSNLPRDHILPAMTSIAIDDDEQELKLLGLRWHPHGDYFHFRIRSATAAHTKRQLASQIARIFDPLGWLIPITVAARAIFRRICQASVGWDQRLTPETQAAWDSFANQLPQLSLLQIPRNIASSTATRFLVGFADASETAYAAAVYLVCHDDHHRASHLVMSKARMAPMAAMTMPRLELCAAHLLSKLLASMQIQFPDIPNHRITALSDSTITLAWITAEPAPFWKVFVGNRVAQILSHVPRQRWRHVATAENPADVASRGALPHELNSHQLWWHGPPWLCLPTTEWPIRAGRANLKCPDVNSEIRSHHLTALPIATATAPTLPLEERFSSLQMLTRVTAWCLRFATNCRNATHRTRGPLAPSELHIAMTVLLRRAQSQALQPELTDASSLRPKFPICKTLGLFIDNDNILKVGGRLRNTDLPYHSKHPALIPADHPLTRLIIHNAHITNLHVGPTATLAFIRARYWIVNGKAVVRRQLARCNRCFSVKPQPFAPVMGQLPASRATPAAPFHVSGVDYAGPFPVKIASLRAARTTQVYIAIFICFTTKAVHIEAVTDLSTPAFLAAYQRFVARRGHPAQIWSDNGRNFLGAANQLRELADLLRSAQLQQQLASSAATRGTLWHFIPPRAPHFGGLWEAAVKSMKRLLKTSIGSHIPCLETFLTIIAQVEAVMNSRPLTPASASPDDLEPLSPGHFLIHRPLNAPPPDESLDHRTALNSKWKAAQHIVQSFWKRWRREYLQHLQVSYKWNTPGNQPQLGQLVIIADELSPPLQWTTGRITHLHLGPDGVCRVAEVRTPQGTYTRPVRKLCPLPTQ